MLGNCFRHSIKDAFEIIQFTSVLYFHNDDFSFAVLRLDVYTVELVISSQLIAFTFEDFHYFHLFIQQYRQQPFEYPKIGFLAQQSFNCPVKSDIAVHCFHNHRFLCITKIGFSIRSNAEVRVKCFCVGTIIFTSYDFDRFQSGYYKFFVSHKGDFYYLNYNQDPFHS